MPATVHMVDADLTETVDARIDFKVYEDRNPNWFRDKTIRDELYTKRADLLTTYVREEYPHIERSARHGDIIQDSSAGYRVNGVFFILTEPCFRVVDKGTDIDEYGGIPKCLRLFRDFPPDHYELSDLACVDETGKTCDGIVFYWHGESVPCWLPDNAKHCPWKYKPEMDVGILTYNRVRYRISRVTAFSNIHDRDTNEHRPVPECVTVDQVTLADPRPDTKVGSEGPQLHSVTLNLKSFVREAGVTIPYGCKDKQLIREYEEKRSQVVTRHIRDTYPDLEHKARHGDFLQDVCYDGVYVVQTRPEFRILRDYTGSFYHPHIPRALRLFRDFELGFYRNIRDIVPIKHDDFAYAINRLPDDVYICALSDEAAELAPWEYDAKTNSGVLTVRDKRYRISTTEYAVYDSDYYPPILSGDNSGSNSGEHRKAARPPVRVSLSDVTEIVSSSSSSSSSSPGSSSSSRAARGSDVEMDTVGDSAPRTSRMVRAGRDAETGEPIYAPVEVCCEVDQRPREHVSGNTTQDGTDGDVDMKQAATRLNNAPHPLFRRSCGKAGHTHPFPQTAFGFNRIAHGPNTPYSKERGMRAIDAQVVVYHFPCPDGFAAAIVAYAYNPNMTFVPWNRRNVERLCDSTRNKRVLFLDIAPRADVIPHLDMDDYLILDHHKSTQQDMDHVPNRHKVFNMDESGVSLAFEAFRNHFRVRNLPKLLEYVKLRDLWKHKDVDGAAETVAGADLLYGYCGGCWLEHLSHTGAEDPTLLCARIGHGVLAQQQRLVRDAMRKAGVVRSNSGFIVRIVNVTDLKIVSDLGCELVTDTSLLTKGDSDTDTDGEEDNNNDNGNDEEREVGGVDRSKLFAMLWRYNHHNNVCSVSLRSLQGVGPDVAAIAERAGGGGHKHAAGFSVETRVPATYMELFALML